MRIASRSVEVGDSRVKPRWLWLVSIGAALAIFAVASLLESDVSVALTYPGLLLTWPIWPEGIHTGSGGAASAVTFYIAFVIGNILFWAILIRYLLGAIVKKRQRPA